MTSLPESWFWKHLKAYQAGLGQNAYRVGLGRVLARWARDRQPVGLPPGSQPVRRAWDRPPIRKIVPWVGLVTGHPFGGLWTGILFGGPLTSQPFATSQTPLRLAPLPLLAQNDYSGTEKNTKIASKISHFFARSASLSECTVLLAVKATLFWGGFTCFIP